MSVAVNSRRPTIRTGMTLLELVVVLAILLALSVIVSPLLTGQAEEARITATRESQRRLQELIMNRYWPDMNNVLLGRDGVPQPSTSDLTGSPVRMDNPQLYFLFVKPFNAPAFDPITRRGWNGPYLLGDSARYPVGFSSLYGQVDDATVIDGWGRPMVIQRYTAGVTAEERSLYTRLVSAGPDGAINTPTDVAIPSKAICGDDIVLYLRIADPRP